ncbi:hypothetical protein [Mammaliicoccus sciuri]|uniref:hypothetical protein n=1 Tax=Mammaliicoccus sciuri TaxID=1296 RepID=UPI00195077D5|nr:hypothetical protein [Mammaliicoccus sciuri]UXV33110.1 hypothetical protein MUA60_04840 [Mammaliicoccus sciuri]
MERITLTKQELESLEIIQEDHMNQFYCLVNDIFNDVISNSKTIKEAKEKLKELRIHSGTNGETMPLITIYKKVEEILDKKIDATPIQEWHRGEI